MQAAPPTLFTTVLVSENRIYNLDRHIEKLKASLLLADLQPLDFSKEHLFSFLSSQENLSGDYRLKIIASNPIEYELLPYSIQSRLPCHLGTYPTSFYEDLAHCKKLDFARRLSLKAKADLQGYDDWIYSSENQVLLETSIANVFWIRSDTFYTPSSTLPLYSGVTLQVAIAAAKSLGMKIEFVTVKKIDQINQSHVFICNSLKKICPVLSIDQKECKYDAQFIDRFKRAYSQFEDVEKIPKPSLLSSLEK